MHHDYQCEEVSGSKLVVCLFPIKAYRSRERSETGRYAVTFNPHNNLIEGSSFHVPCGRCQGCRVARSREWAVRCMHEAKMYDFNQFITLTYDDKHLPDDYSVDVRTFQLFMKRLREALPQRIRYFACGEYGDQTLRPHYHALIFNHYFNDQKYYKTTQSNSKIYTSKKLDDIWQLGQCYIGNVTYRSAAYTARYTFKKIGGEIAADHYTRIHPLSGNLVRVKPEFAVGSRRPGIGYSFFQKFKSDFYPSDFCTVEGKRHPIPRYYTQLLAEEEAQHVKRLRKVEANKHREDNTPARLAVRGEVLAARLKMLKREL